MNMPFVEIVGAGPGAEDLITMRGLRALQQADLVVYAGSLVAPALLRHCRPDCLCRDSASMDLAEQVAVMSEAALAGKRVVRLHTGDPALYGAIDEQIRGLAQRGI
ncbi:MAG: SAM-dependent methyltransferase, partial [Desulfovibrio piger]